MIKRFFKKFINSMVALALVFQLNVFSAMITTTPVKAAQQCAVDSAGADDEPGQKDLTKMCVDYASAPTTIQTIWNWDETGTNGANTLDGCALFDTDNDGNINYATCVTTTGSPATLQSLTTYSCGDTKPDRCTSTAAVVSSGSTSCAVSIQATNPFDASQDAVATCTIYLNTVGGASAKLVDVCSYPSGQPNSDPSDCVVFVEGKIEIRKVLVGGSDTFNLLLDEDIVAAGVGNGGTSGEIGVETGDYQVSETAATGSLANYSTTIVCKDLNGTGSTVASSQNAGPLEVTVDAYDDIVCVITNTLSNGTLRVVKNLVNNNGGTKTNTDFSFKINGGSNNSFEADGSNDYSVTPGTYSVVENTDSLYATSYNNCSNVTVVSNQITTCTITNDDIAPSLTLNKILVKNNGGDASESNWTLTATGSSQNPTNLSGAGAAGSADVVSGASFKADTYTLGESGGPSGYSASAWTCTNGVTVNGQSQITLSLGQTTVCSITNDDVAPSLTVYKIVNNDNGGTLTADDFDIKLGQTELTFTKMSADGVNPAIYSSSPTVVANQQYTVSESNLAGYNEGEWSCKLISSDQNMGATFTLEAGQNATCTITNDDVAPTLTIYKEFKNTYGTTGDASDFDFYIGATQVTLGDPYAIMPGLVDFSESFLYGWKLVDIEGENCGDPSELGGSFTAVLGVSYECTLVNEDQPATLVVTKYVYNNNGGDLEADDFAEYITVDGYNGDWALGDELELRTDTEYTVEENLPDNYGYTFDGVNCWDNTGDGDAVPLKNGFTPYPGQEISCTVFNDDIAPQVQVRKNVINDNSGDADGNYFGITVDGESQDMEWDEYFETGDKDTKSYRDTTTVEANKDIVIKEDTSDDYEEGEWACTVNSQTIYGEDQAITVKLLPGQIAYCEITNNDIPHPSIYVEKYGPDVAHEGDEVDYSFYVTNDGDVDLTSIDVEDDIAGNATFWYSYGDDDEVLEVGETWVYTASYVIPSDQDEHVVNTVTACGSMYFDDVILKISDLIEIDEVTEPDVCGTDSHELDVLHPEIKVVKSGPATAKAGEKVTYTFTVTNVGDVELEDITVVDSLTGNGVYVSGDTNGDEILDLDETWIYKGDYTIPANQTANVVNTVEACGFESFFFQEESKVSLVQDIIIEDRRVETCDSDNHTLKIPVTIVLSNTGLNSSAIMLVSGLILTTVAGLEIARRRSAKKN